MTSNEHDEVDFNILPDVDGIMEDITAMTHPVLTNIRRELAEANHRFEIEKQTADNFRTRLSIKNEQVEKLRAVLGSLVFDEEIEATIAASIAGIFGITLTKTVEVEATFKVNVSVDIPLGDEMTAGEIADYIGISVDYHGSGELLEDSFILDDWREIS